MCCPLAAWAHLVGHQDAAGGIDDDDTIKLLINLAGSNISTISFVACRERQE
jgi:hypothetical protein